MRQGYTPNRPNVRLPALALTAALLLPAVAYAQGSQSLPGVIVRVPPSAGDSAAGTGRAAPADKGQSQPKASAKTKSASLDSSGSGKRRGSVQSIVVLVNDDPITAYQVDQRARLLAVQS